MTLTPMMLKALQDLKKAVLCTKCEEVMLEPHTLPCGHHYCLDCAKEVISDRKIQGCGVCKQVCMLKDTVQNVSLRKIVAHVERLQDLSQRYLALKAAKKANAAAAKSQERKKRRVSFQNEAISAEAAMDEPMGSAQPVHIPEDATLPVRFSQFSQNSAPQGDSAPPGTVPVGVLSFLSGTSGAESGSIAGAGPADVTMGLSAGTAERARTASTIEGRGAGAAGSVASPSAGSQLAAGAGYAQAAGVASQASIQSSLGTQVFSYHDETPEAVRRQARIDRKVAAAAGAGAGAGQGAGAASDGGHASTHKALLGFESAPDQQGLMMDDSSGALYRPKGAAHNGTTPTAATGSGSRDGAGASSAATAGARGRSSTPKATARSEDATDDEDDDDVVYTAKGRVAGGGRGAGVSAGSKAAPQAVVNRRQAKTPDPSSSPSTTRAGVPPTSAQTKGGQGVGVQYYDDVEEIEDTQGSTGMATAVQEALARAAAPALAAAPAAPALSAAPAAPAARAIAASPSRRAGTGALARADASPAASDASLSPAYVPVKTTILQKLMGSAPAPAAAPAPPTAPAPSAGPLGSNSKGKAAVQASAAVPPARPPTGAALYAATGKIVLCTSSLTPADKALASRAVAVLSSRGTPAVLDDSFTPHTTHVVTAVDPVAETGRAAAAARGVAGLTHSAKRTLKVAQAILTGCWLVSVQWLAAIVKEGRPVQEAQYEDLRVEDINELVLAGGGTIEGKALDVGALVKDGRAAVAALPKGTILITHFNKAAEVPRGMNVLQSLFPASAMNAACEFTKAGAGGAGAAAGAAADAAVGKSPSKAGEGGQADAAQPARIAKPHDTVVLHQIWLLDCASRASLLDFGFYSTGGPSFEVAMKKGNAAAQASGAAQGKGGAGQTVPIKSALKVSQAAGAGAVQAGVGATSAVPVGVGMGKPAALLERMPGASNTAYAASAGSRSGAGIMAPPAHSSGSFVPSKTALHVAGASGAAPALALGPGALHTKKVNFPDNLVVGDYTVSGNLFGPGHR